MRRYRAVVVGVVAAVSIGWSVPALANGGDFFEELAASWSMYSESGVPFFGFIKDNKGKLIGNVSVKATTPNGSTFIVQSDAKGRYRIPGFSKTVDAKGVEITCMKTGYKLMVRDRRLMRGRANAPVETNCIMAPEGPAPIS